MGRTESEKRKKEINAREDMRHFETQLKISRVSWGERSIMKGS